MKYKLKEHVMDEMLIECGFEVIKGILLSDKTKTWDNFVRKTTNPNVELYIMKNTNYEPYIADDGIIEDNYANEQDLTPYIQDLLDLDYVEELK